MSHFSSSSYTTFSLSPLQGEDIKDFINPNSRRTSLAMGEPALRNVQHGTIIQLERKGFFRVDKAFVRAGQVGLQAALCDIPGMLLRH